MNCDEVKNILMHESIEYIKKIEKTDFVNHIKECKECSKLYSAILPLENISNVVDELPEISYARLTKKIVEQIEAEEYSEQSNLVHKILEIIFSSALKFSYAALLVIMFLLYVQIEYTDQAKLVTLEKEFSNITQTNSNSFTSKDASYASLNNLVSKIFRKWNSGKLEKDKLVFSSASEELIRMLLISESKRNDSFNELLLSKNIIANDGLSRDELISLFSAGDDISKLLGINIKGE